MCTVLAVLYTFSVAHSCAFLIRTLYLLNQRVVTIWDYRCMYMVLQVSFLSMILQSLFGILHKALFTWGPFSKRLMYLMTVAFGPLSYILSFKYSSAGYKGSILWPANMHNWINPVFYALEKEATQDLSAIPFQQGVPTTQDLYIWTFKVYIFVITAPVHLWL